MPDEKGTKTKRKRGNPNWQKGVSGNPTGRPPLTDAQKEAREMLKAASPDAVRALSRALESDSEDTRIKAAQAILAKVFPQGIDLTISGPGGGPVSTLALDPRKLTTAQLDAILAALPVESTESD